MNYPWPTYTSPNPDPSLRHPPNGTRALSIQEQTGTDPTSKLAAAIERLCDILEQPEE